MTSGQSARTAEIIAERVAADRTRPCPACGGQKSGGADLLCIACWRKLPRVLVQLYRFVWRLKQVELVDGEAFAELERLVVLDAGGVRPRRATGPMPSAVAAAKLAASAAPPSKAPRPERARRAIGTTGAQILAVLPSSAEQAIDAAAVRQRLGWTGTIVDVWLSANREKVPTLGCVNDRPGSQRGRYRYWRRAA